MPSVTKTLGPLHFEDLEPKRFEDLTRQLIYDFRPWRRLEATGRSGSDDGFDARGYEIVSVDNPPSEEDADEAIVVGASDRLWLVQCKRERTITPKKLVAYLDDIKLAEGEALHGIVFAAACDFSKTARDQFRDKCAALGIHEWHLWGKAELEDKLFHPDNDSLLFAYFGVSLAIRRRSQRTDLRARLVIKRKANRLLAGKLNGYCLLRSPEATSYPNPEDVADFKTQPPWMVRRYHGMTYAGLTFCVRRHFAFISDEGTEWDAAMVFNDALPSGYQDPWATEHGPDNSDLRQKLFEIWSNLPDANKAWMEVIGVIPFEDVLDIDEFGDEFVKEPHLYVPFLPKTGPFSWCYANVEPVRQHDERTLSPSSDEKTRLAIFPKEFREYVPLAQS